MLSLKPTLPQIKLLLPFFITLAALTLSSCCSGNIIPVSISDEPLYYIKGSPALPDSFSNYAVEMHFLSTGQTDMTKDEIDAISQGMVMMPLSSFEDFNTEIGKLCSEAPCDYSVKSALNDFFLRLTMVTGHNFEAIR